MRHAAPRFLVLLGYTLTALPLHGDAAVGHRPGAVILAAPVAAAGAGAAPTALASRPANGAPAGGDAARSAPTGQVFTDSGISLTALGQTVEAWGDYDNDGDLDLAMIGCSAATGYGDCWTPNSKLYRNDGGAFTSVAAGLTPAHGGNLDWGDYDNDGDLDLLLSGCTQEGLWCYQWVNKLYRNESGGSFTDTGISREGVWGDYDNDGDLDILGDGEVHRNDGGGTFAPAQTVAFTSRVYPAAWADYDGDGDLDFALAVTVGGADVTALFRNDGGSFFRIIALPPGLFGYMAWGDYDSDGDLDLLISGYEGAGGSTPVARLFRNDGAAAFTDIGAGLPAVRGPARWGDYDNDGDLDILLVGGSTAQLFRNDAGAFVDSGEVLPTGVGSVAWGDYDNDGDLDLVFGGHYTGSMMAAIYRNDGASANTVPTAPTGLSAVAGRLAWTAASDPQTPAAGLSYNLRVGTVPGASDVVSPMSDTTSGFRRVARMGEAGPGTGAILTGLDPGTYYWSVQAVDSGLAGSPFAPEASVAVCATTFTPPSASVQATAGSSSVGVTAAPGCGWAATSQAGWITVTGGATGSGDGTVVYSFGANPGPARIGTIALAGQAFSVQQASGCAYTIDPTGADLLAAGGSGSTTVTTQDGCPWTAASNAAWITVYDPSGTGSGTSTYGVAANGGDARTGTLTVAGATFTVNQAASPFRDAGSITGVRRSAVAWADCDNDGDLDLAVMGQTAGGVAVTQVHRNDGSGALVDIGAGLTGLSMGSLAWGDYDNDGDVDLVAAGLPASGPTVAKVWRNDGGGSFVDIGAGLAGALGGGAAWGDYDNDGDLDLLVAGNGTRVYRNDGGVFVDIAAALANTGASRAAWGDYDNDGDLDILVSTRVYRNDGGGEFVNIAAPLSTSAYAAAWGDYDNDGDLDLLSGPSLLRNDGGAFVATGVNLGSRPYSAAWGDYDNDGDLDVLLIDSDATLSSRVYRNEGNGSFVAVATPAQFTGSLSGGEVVAWGDYDGDGDLDLVVSGDIAGTHLFRNESPVANAVPTAPAGLVATAAAGPGPVTFAWTASADGQTPAAGLTYNLRLGTTPGGGQVVSPMSAVPSGGRRIVQFGNAGHGTTAILGPLPLGTYYWSVQALDTALAGSPFAPESTLVIANERLSVDDVTVTEGNSGTTAASFTVTLAPASSRTVTVRYATADGTATAADDDYLAVSGTLTFAPGVTTQPVEVAVHGDLKYEPNETFTLDLSSATNATIEDGTGVATVTNDDAATVVIGTRSKTVATAPFVPGSPVTYTVTLSNVGSATQADNAGHELVDVLSSDLTSISASATSGTASVSGSTVSWDGSIPSGGSVTITIGAAVKATVGVGTVVSNQATIAFDADVDGTNEASALTDDPGLGGPDDPTRFTVAPPGLGFHTLTPCRLVDTRNAAGTYGGPALEAAIARVFPLAGQCGIPPSARAVSVNVTVTAATAQGNLRLSPGGLPTPLVSTINYLAGQTRANNAVAPLNALGELAVYCSQASGTAHFVLDVNGYFE